MAGTGAGEDVGTGSGPDPGPVLRQALQVSTCRTGMGRPGPGPEEEKEEEEEEEGAEEEEWVTGRRILSGARRGRIGDSLLRNSGVTKRGLAPGLPKTRGDSSGCCCCSSCCERPWWCWREAGVVVVAAATDWARSRAGTRRVGWESRRRVGVKVGPVVGWGLRPLVGCSDNGCGLPVAPRDWEEEEEEEDGDGEEGCSLGAATGWDWESAAPVAPPTPPAPPATVAAACVGAPNG